MNKIVKLVILVISFISCQGQEKDDNSNLKGDFNLELNNKITSEHKLIPNTRIYVIPNPNSQITNNMISNGNNYSISITHIDSTMSKNKVSDFTKERFEKKGIRVFKLEKIKINNTDGIYVQLQGDINQKGIIIFLDNVVDKIMVQSAYHANDIKSEKEIIGILNSIVFQKDEILDPLKFAKFKLDLSNTPFKYFNSGSNFYVYSLNGIDNPLEKPQLIVSQLPKDNSASLENFADYMIAQLQKYGLENSEVKNIKKTKLSYEAEIYGMLDSKQSLIYLKLITQNDKDYIVSFQCTTRENLDENLKEFKKIGETLKIK